MGVSMRRDHEHACALSDAVTKQAHPSLHIRLDGLVTSMPEQQVKSALGEEELLGRAITLLAAKIPEVQGHRLAGKRWMGALHGLHLKPSCRDRRGEGISDQPLL
jgi:hypothetical protein